MRAQLDELQEELIFVHQVDVNAGVGSNLNIVDRLFVAAVGSKGPIASTEI